MIIILTQCFPSRVGGIENLVSNLAFNLSETEKVIVLADRHNFLKDAIYDNSVKERYHVRRVGGIKYFRRRRKVKELKPFLLSGQVKYIIADSWKSFELPLKMINKFNISTICLTHGNELLSNDKYKINRIKVTLNHVTKIIANSFFTKNLVENLLSATTEVKVVHPGANDLTKLNEKVIDNIKGNPILLTLARLEKRKGHEYIINSIKKILPKFPNIQYIIAGEGPEKNYLKRLVIENKLEKNIKFVGMINDYQKKYLFSKTNLMIMPTLDKSDQNSIEGFGIAYLEAAFFGIPSIASDVGGTTEAVLHKETGIIIKDINELYNILDTLLSDEKYLKDLGSQAKNRALKDFKWSKVVKKYII